MSEMKNGMPMSEVTIPIGKTVPGMSDLLTTELADRMSAPDRAEVGRKNAGPRR
jgi:hypothetical protein